MLAGPAGLLLAAGVAGCGGPVEMPTVDLDTLDDPARAACAAFAADLPDTLAGRERRQAEPADAYGAAYGDPAITVICGVPVPGSFTETSACQAADGVGWYLPPDQLDDPDADVTLTTPGHRPVVELVVPGDYRPEGPAAALAELAPLVREHLTLVDDCR